MSITPKLPLNLGENELYDSTDDVVVVTRFHIKNIILTNPGEKISDPNFGVGVKRYLFENFSNNLVSSLNSRVRSQIARYAPTVEVLSLKVSPFVEDNSLSFSLSYYIPVINKTDILSFTISNSSAIY
jgi:hypothetical protein|tara:strand:- start:539 stop:922 length:384 start_codon:yes stop_codon:yes gene_type:complete